MKPRAFAPYPLAVEQGYEDGTGLRKKPGQNITQGDLIVAKATGAEKALAGSTFGYVAAHDHPSDPDFSDLLGVTIPASKTRIEVTLNGVATEANTAPGHQLGLAYDTTSGCVVAVEDASDPLIEVIGIVDSPRLCGTLGDRNVRVRARFILENTDVGTISANVTVSLEVPASDPTIN